MANSIKLTCISSTASENGGHILKLQNKEVVTVDTGFGMKTQGKQQTYYMKVDAACLVGKVAILDLEHFRIIEHPFDIVTPPVGAPDEDGYIAGKIETIQLKWLSI